MSGHDYDRHLLTGVMALQMGYITSAQLLTVLRRWTQDKSRTIESILSAQDLVDSEQLATLMDAVECQLKSESESKSQALAELYSTVVPLEDEIHSLDDPDLSRSLLETIATADLNDPFKTAPTLKTPPSRSGDKRFRVLRPHAQGGLGQVSVALDQELNREVAFKEIRPQHTGRQDSRDRFVLEAEVTGGLEHPGIVPIYALGTYPDGRPYYAMRFIRGESLKEAIDRFHGLRSTDKTTPGGSDEPTLGLTAETAKKFSTGQMRELRQLLGRLVDASQAMAYAHSRGVLHRDIKPANIMLGEYGETLVVDWGLAKIIGRSDQPIERPLVSKVAGTGSQTLDGAAMGTPQYMSPEQAAGRIDELEPATDIYSLGATLYHILTGQPPQQGTDLLELLKQIQSGDLIPPHELRAGIPKALSAVCMKALATHPEDRYSSASEFAADLENWLADEPVSVMREPLLDRAARLIRRYRGTFVTGTVAVVLIAALATIAALLINEKRVENQQLAEDRRLLLESEQQLTDQLTDANSTLADRNDALQRANDHLQRASYATQLKRVAELWRTQPEQARQILLDEQLCPSRLREFVWGMFWELSDRCVRTIPAHRDAIVQVAVSHDGRHLASVSRDGELQLRSAATGEQVSVPFPEGRVLSVAWTPDDALLLGREDSYLTVVIDRFTGERLQSFRSDRSAAMRVAASDDGRQIAAIHADGSCTVWSNDTDANVWQPSTESIHARCLDFSPDSRRLAIGTAAGKLIVYELESQQAAFQIDAHQGEVSAVDFAPQGDRIATASQDRSVKVWSTTTHAELWHFTDHTAPVHAVEFSHTGTSLLSAGLDTTLRIRDANTGQDRLTQKNYSPGVLTATWLPDQTSIVAGSQDGHLRFWHSPNSREWIASAGTNDRVVDVVPQPKEKQLLLVHSQGDWTQLDLQTLAREHRQFKTVNGTTTAAAMSDDGQHVALAIEQDVLIMDRRQGHVVARLSGHQHLVTDLEFLPGGRQLASGSLDQTIRIWDVETADVVSTIENLSAGVNVLVRSQRADRIIAGLEDATIQVISFDNAERPIRLSGHSLGVSALVFSEDERLLASAGFDGSVILWNTQDWTVHKSLTSHNAMVRDLEFVHGASTLAAVGSDQIIQFWDVATGLVLAEQQVMNLRRGVGKLTELASDRSLLGCTLDGELRMWKSSRSALSTLSGHARAVTSLAVNASGNVIASGGLDNTIKLWDPDTGRERRTLLGHEATVEQIQFVPQLDLLISGSLDGTVRVWTMPDGALMQTLTGHTGNVSVMSLIPGPVLRLIVGGFDGTCVVWNLATWEQERVVQVGTERITAMVADSIDGRLWLGSQSGKLWRLDVTETVTPVLVHQVEDEISALAMDPQRHSLLLGTSRGGLHRFDVQAGIVAEQQTLTTSRISAIHVSEAALLVASGEFLVRLRKQAWDSPVMRSVQAGTIHAIEASTHKHLFYLACEDERVYRVQTDQFFAPSHSDQLRRHSQLDSARQRRDWPQVVSHLSALMEMAESTGHSDSTASHIDRARAYLEWERLEDALQDYRDALSQTPDDLVCLGSVLLLEKRLEQETPAAKQATAQLVMQEHPLDPDDPSTHFWLQVMLSNEEIDPLTLNRLSSRLTVPEEEQAASAAWWEISAGIAFRQGRLTQAIEQFERAATLQAEAATLENTTPGSIVLPSDDDASIFTVAMLAKAFAAAEDPQQSEHWINILQSQQTWKSPHERELRQLFLAQIADLRESTRR